MDCLDKKKKKKKKKKKIEMFTGEILKKNVGKYF